MLTALANTARDLGAGLLIALALFSGSLLAGLFLGRLMRDPETPEFKRSGEPKDPGDLDDWLAEVGPLEEFKLWERPMSQSELERRAA